jgi:hypothetical protein
MRDYVFSATPFDLQWKKDQADFKKNFEEKKVASLGSFAKKVLKIYITTPIEKIKFSSMPLFSGSISESMGPIASYAKNENIPYLLLDELEDQFLLALPLVDNKDCGQAVLVATKIRGEKGSGKGIQSIGRMCDGVIKWGEF